MSAAGGQTDASGGRTDASPPGIGILEVLAPLVERAVAELRGAAGREEAGPDRG